MGIKTFMLKPFLKSDLAKTIRKVLDSRKEQIIKTRTGDR